jgi:CubicO group peptidase (beta-lactamase class C family)
MLTFLREHQVPGASLAIAKDGRLVYARGFGHADRERGDAVQPRSLFRIGSISKPVTAVAVLQLAERGRLSPATRVWEFLGLAEPRDARWKQVTVLHLLQHRGGWDRARSFDPMFRSHIVAKELGTPPPAGAGEVIRYMLRQPLDFEPGSRDAYSNFGYALLGRVVEKASGFPYEQYVQAEVLRPLGIRRMRLARTLRVNRAPDEVSYYDEKGRTGRSVVDGAQVPLPYGGTYMEAMDAPGGWLAGAADLACFASAFDEPDACRILSRASIERMFARPEGAAGPVYYACGWEVRPNAKLHEATAWHNGALAGCCALMMRSHLRRNWVVLFNTRADQNGRLLDNAVAPRLLRTAGFVDEWPARDQFQALL